MERSKKLYKGRFLIAIYDKRDYLLEVLVSPSESKLYSKRSLFEMLSRKMKNPAKYKNIYLIDVFEKHNDAFADEDKIFLNFVKNSNISDAKIAEHLGINLRSLYRKKRQSRSFAEMIEKLRTEGWDNVG